MFKVSWAHQQSHLEVSLMCNQSVFLILQIVHSKGEQQIWEEPFTQLDQTLQTLTQVFSTTIQPKLMGVLYLH
ncbi:hypothetical protein FGO68_gene4331 [Halteria grandinella]|uniref:Uncharacterized protein n=1 Tax=Halteria grandinella TaxID=5974 RepID=A0A8J8SXW6_HALGN|nr:hypothetical protein FGO68_gene4331 [Halteria grandinella]